MRLFIALEFDETPFRNIQSSLDPNAFVLTRHIHLTLKFLGNVSEKEYPLISSALEKVHHDAFSLSFENTCSAFPSMRNPRVIFVPAKGTEVKKLAGKIDVALRTWFSPESKFVAHVTVARAREPTTTMPTMKQVIPSMRITSFAIIESDLTAGTYSVKKRISLS